MSFHLANRHEVVPQLRERPVEGEQIHVLLQNGSLLIENQLGYLTTDLFVITALDVLTDSLEIFFINLGGCDGSDGKLESVDASELVHFRPNGCLLLRGFVLNQVGKGVDEERGQRFATSGRVGLSLELSEGFLSAHEQLLVALVHELTLFLLGGLELGILLRDVLLGRLNFLRSI